jgi:hypothetical protein
MCFVLSASTDMPAATRISVATKQPADTPAAAKAPSKPVKKRVVRRRGRGRHESDDEIEREAASDSDSQSSDESSVGSSSDSEPENPSEAAVQRADPPVQSHSPEKSPDNAPPNPPTRLNGQSGRTPFFAPSSSWSEMVAEENVNGSADLPVIDFADMSTPSGPSRTHRSKKAPQILKRDSQPASLPSPPLSTKEEPDKETEDESEKRRASLSQRRPRDTSFPDRPPGQSARQAYQNRLDSDPSYVPTVGEFWGHDDRLLDKNLRSLSGWWRGRWQGRGRGRGFDRGRGRGGFGGRPFTRPTDVAAEESLPPTERQWTHDGFEEMRRIEVRKTATHQAASRGFRGRGGVPYTRGRDSARGGSTASPSRTNNSSPVPALATSQASASVATATSAPTPAPRIAPSKSVVNVAGMPSDRVWFKMKPPLMWTKQHDGYLYQQMPARPADGPMYRVRLPGRGTKVVRGSKWRAPRTALTTTPKSSSTVDSDADLPVVVRLPTTAGGRAPVADESPVTVDDTDMFTVRPHLVAANPIPLPEPSNVRSSISLSNTQHSRHSSAHLPDPVTEQQLSQLSVGPQAPDPARYAQTEVAVLRNPTGEGSPSPVQREQSVPPPPVPEQVPHLSQLPYGSPYGYPTPLPPGVAYNQMGIPYDMATGRPMYIPPPQPMFNVVNPRPMMHPAGMAFAPGHIRHQSTVEYTQQHTPTPSEAPSEASMPAPPMSRQNSAVSIRSPVEAVKTAARAGHQRAQSMLRVSASEFKPTSLPLIYSQETKDPDSAKTAATQTEQMQLPLTSESGMPQPDPDMLMSQSLPQDPDPMHYGGVPPNMMMYNPYQPQYYYAPDAYGYNPYIDMSQYGEMYPGAPPESQHHGGTVYY